MKNLPPKAFWLFFLSRSVGLVFVLLVFFLPLYVTSRLYTVTDRELRSPGRSGDYLSREYQEERGIASTIFRPFFYIHYGFAGLILLLLVVNYVWAKYFYATYRFELAEKGLRIEKGVIWKRFVTIPYERIQNVDILR